MTMFSAEFIRVLKSRLSEANIYEDEFRRFAFSTDASFYRLMPKLVVQIDDESELRFLIQTAANYKIPLTFRAAGTSLSGQAVTEHVLVLLSDRWTRIGVAPLAESVTLQPGVIGSKANRSLKPFQRKIGPDPASINACKIGGIVANNASGMCCGTKHNSYHTLQGIRVVLADGSVVDTRSEQSVAEFRASHAEFLDNLASLRQRLLNNAPLIEHVRHKYRLKNTTGYGINALLDFDDPIDILAHLMVGSEGTLGFISEVTLRTVPDHPHKASAFVAFDSLTDCAETVAKLKSEPVDAVELLDARAVASVISMPGMPEFATALPDSGGMLLIDVRGSDSAHLQQNLNSVTALLAACTTSGSTGFTQNGEQIDRFWQIRKGTFPAVGAVREAGSTVIIEDVAFPIEKLAEGVSRLQALFDKYGYDEANIFGHALEGNLHFVFTQRFDDDAARRRYEGLMNDVAEMVAVEFGGSLKAEHGTGRNMAPFVELEWGKDAYELMTQIKQLFDPHGLLNPGVVLNDDPGIHLKHLKPMPEADDLVDACIECGFCEDVCPSQHFTLTPRQRIAIYREMQRRQRSGQPPTLDWRKSFQEMSINSCAATGMCESRCPVGINTGELVLKLRARNNQPYRRFSEYLSRNFAAVASWVRLLLAISYRNQQIFGPERLERWSAVVRRFTRNKTPLWLSTTPGRGRPIYARNRGARPDSKDTVVYWSSCASQSMSAGVGEDRQAIPTTVASVLQKANLTVVYPQPTRGLCCGQPFRSKGQPVDADRMRDEVVDALWEVSGAGRYPVLSDASPCSLQVKQYALERGIKVYDSAEFIDRFLLDRLNISPREAKTAVHIPCSARKQQLEKSFQRVLNRLAPDWVIPEDIQCCGFAGDKGFTLPELNQSALRLLNQQVKDCDLGISTSRTCEIGLARHGGIPYYSLFDILDRHSSALSESARR